MRIVVAMSGGVDSSVAAARLVEEGHDVIGLSMQLYDQRKDGESFGSCCSLDDLQDARRVANTLGIPHYIINFQEQFERTVVRNFVGEYAAGRTPIPCVHCNSDLKFASLVDRAAGLGASAVATGHYARVDFDEDRGRYRLLRGGDEKDQSYFLFTLTQEQLSHAVFPVGHMTKTEVRAHAQRLGLAVADKPDSHEICFVSEGTAADFVERRLADEAGTDGEIVDTSGAVVGRHRGIHRYTVGQRKGLGLSAGTPLYVIRLEPADQRVVVGPRTDLGRSELTASSVNWISGDVPSEPLRVTARIRHRHTDAAATVTAAHDDNAVLVFDEPQMAVTPGQAVVFYSGDEVVGGGWIA